MNRYDFTPRDDFEIEIGTVFGPPAGKIWRSGAINEKRNTLVEGVKIVGLRLQDIVEGRPG